MNVFVIVNGSLGILNLLCFFILRYDIPSLAVAAVCFFTCYVMWSES